jgi:L-ascorbate metabolism protein UlaG (beta-lactamase superfamily)
MQITYLGHSSFKIKTDTATIITDPYSFSVGLHYPKQKAEIVTISHDHEDHNNREGIVNEDCLFIDAPGEYEIKDIMIHGIRSYHDLSKGEDNGKNTVFVINAEGITLCHLGDLGHPLSAEELKEIGNVDVLFVPVGGVFTINASVAKDIVKKIDPSYVIAMHYKQEGLSEVFANMAPIETFVEELGLEPTNMEKLSVGVGSLPEEMELVLLERKK